MMASSTTSHLPTATARATLDGPRVPGGRSGWLLCLKAFDPISSSADAAL
jgi:hypothetical protein